jgi:hypothetical protein
VGGGEETLNPKTFETQRKGGNRGDQQFPKPRVIEQFEILAALGFWLLLSSVYSVPLCFKGFNSGRKEETE